MEQEGYAACYMWALSAAITNVDIVLQKNECISLGQDTSDIALTNITFEGVLSLATEE